MRYYTVADNGDWLEAEEQDAGAQEYDEHEHFLNLKDRIDAWDHEDVRELRDLINQIPDEVKDRLHYDMLPSESIPAGLETYPIWACDKHGRCLVGDTADDIEDLISIQEWYQEKTPTHSITANGYESLEKVAKRNGNSSAVTLPASWLGHKVLCIRLD